MVETLTNVPGFQKSLGTASISDAGGVVEISRWCKPPVSTTKCGEPRPGRRSGRRAISAAPAGARIQSSRRTGGLHHRLMSNVPPGQVAATSALILDMQCVLVGLRSKTSPNEYSPVAAVYDRRKALPSARHRLSAVI